MVCSARRSAWLTKSDGPLTLTCSCSTSAKSRSSRRAAFCAAFCMTVICGERRRAIYDFLGSPLPPGEGEERGRSGLRPLHVAGVLRADHDAFAGFDERRHGGLHAVAELG